MHNIFASNSTKWVGGSKTVLGQGNDYNGKVIIYNNAFFGL